MTAEEYDRQFKGRSPRPADSPAQDPTQAESIIVDGRAVAPLRIHLVNSSPQQMNQREHDALRGQVEVVGRTEGGVDLIRRVGGADYAGREQWYRMMARCGRLGKTVGGVMQRYEERSE